MANKFDYCALTSRVRLARNLAAYPFKGGATAGNGVIIEQVARTLKPLGEFNLIRMSELEGAQAEYLKDKYIVSPYLSQNLQTGAVIISEDETFSVMINEEDHLREQCVCSGFNIAQAYDNLRYLDRKLSERMEFARDEEFGYITACMTNLGTGMRASVMLFLPALTESGGIAPLIKEMKSLGLTVRGATGEGSKPVGCMYQVSNEVTLGYSEEEILKMVTFATRRLCELEYAERERIHSNDPIGIEDDCFRAYGILTNCRKIGYEEFAQHFIKVALGAFYGFYDIDFATLGNLFVNMRPAILTYMEGAYSTLERDVVRARIVSSQLKDHSV